MSKPRSVGNGDICPLVPAHGVMMALASKPAAAPMQWCPHQMHDGQPKQAAEGPPPRSRSLWPLYGFEATVASYMARLHHAVSLAELPDLSDLEVL
jgi:hypothetical protein